jgi:hypothetical protein
MSAQTEFMPKTYGATPFDQFLEWDELPGIRNFVVGDIRKLDVTPWRRRGGLGCFLAPYIEAIRQFKTNKQVVYSIIAKSSGLKERAEIEEYHSLLTKNFLLDHPMPTLLGVKTVLEDLGTKNPKVREIKPEDLLETRFLRELKQSGANNRKDER